MPRESGSGPNSAARMAIDFAATLLLRRRFRLIPPCLRREVCRRVQGEAQVILGTLWGQEKRFWGWSGSC